MGRVELPPSGRSTLVLILGAHHAALGLHAVAHEFVGIALMPFQQAFVAVVIISAPILGVVLLFTRLARAGLVIFVVSMVASLLFGVLSHVALPGPDNVFQVGNASWAFVFTVTGGVMAITEVWGGLVGARFLRRRQDVARAGVGDARGWWYGGVEWHVAHAEGDAVVAGGEGGNSGGDGGGDGGGGGNGGGGGD